MEPTVTISLKEYEYFLKCKSAILQRKNILCSKHDYLQGVYVSNWYLEAETEPGKKAIERINELETELHKLKQVPLAKPYKKPWWKF